MPVSINKLLFISIFVMFSLIANSEQVACAHLNINGPAEVGAIGIASTVAVPREQAKQLAAARAKNKFEASHGQIHQPNFYYYNLGVNVIAIAANSKQTIVQCPNAICNFKTCSPEWLCNRDERESVISVSQRATSLPAQFEKLDQNLDKIASFLSHSKVSIAEKYLSVSDNSLETHYQEENNRISASNTLQHDYKLRGFCFTNNEALFAEYWQPNEQTPKLSSERQTGFGMVDGLVSSGLLSDKIMLAIKRALIDLAKQLSIDVSSNVEVKVTDNKIFKLIDISNKGSTTVSAQLSSLAINPLNDNYSIEVKVANLNSSPGEDNEN